MKIMNSKDMDYDFDMYMFNCVKYTGLLSCSVLLSYLSGLGLEPSYHKNVICFH